MRGIVAFVGLVMVVGGLAAFLTPFRNTLATVTSGWGRGDTATVEVAGVDSVYIVFDQVSMQPMLHALHAQDRLTLLALTAGLKMGSVPVHTRVSVVDVEAVDHEVVARVHAYPDGDQSHPVDGWLPVAWLERMH